MAVDMFIKIGDIKGESQDGKHKDEIDVLSWSWGTVQSGTGHMGGGAGSGKVNVQDLSITKFTDTATPELWLACCNGKHYGEAKLTLRKAGEKPLEYLVVTMADVIITSVQTGASHSDDRTTESVTLNFAKVKVDYAAQDAKGGAGAQVKVGWDIAKNDKW
jgi:type VI secretion system secreted protein Hcp